MSEVIGIEVKAAATVGAGDFRGLRELADSCGDELKLVVVLHDGAQVVPFEGRMFVAPVRRQLASAFSAEDD